MHWNVGNYSSGFRAYLKKIGLLRRLVFEVLLVSRVQRSASIFVVKSLFHVIYVLIIYPQQSLVFLEVSQFGSNISIFATNPSEPFGLGAISAQLVHF